MQFHEYETVFAATRKVEPELTRDEFLARVTQGFQQNYHEQIQRLAKESWVAGLDKTSDSEHYRNTDLSLRALVEVQWELCKKPYYNVWPGLLSMLLGLDLAKVPMDYLVSPLQDPLLIRLPAQQNDCRLTYMAKEVRKQLGSLILYTSEAEFDGQRLRKYIVIGDVCNGTDSHILLQTYTVGSGMTVRQFFEDSYERPLGPDKLPIADYDYEEFRTFNRYVLTLLTSVCLLGHDPSLLTVDVLSKDRDKFLRETDPAKLQTIIDRARRRGKVGWDLGRNLETMPHWRRPHPALVWTGKGRTEPKVVFRKGSIVHRDKALSVPTGNLANEEVCEDDGNVLEVHRESR